MTSFKRSVALVTQGFEHGGGVPEVARWMMQGLIQTGRYDVEVHDLATSRKDPGSRRLLSPRTWFRRTLRHVDHETRVTHWGANLVELELMRYRPRRELSKALNQFDIVQVVSGGPALGCIAQRVTVPVVLEAATRAAWERASLLTSQSGARRLWWMLMTHQISSFELRAVKAANAVLVPNKGLYSELQPHTTAPVVLIPHGIDTRRFRPNPDGYRSDGPLLSVCRLGDPRKGLDRLILAYALLLKRVPHAPRLILAGRGKLPMSTLDAIRRHNLAERIEIVSDVKPKDLPHLYQAASVYVQTSYEEGFGLSVAEAMASGLPVVCTDTAGTRETVADGATGWVVPQEPGFSPDEMAGALAVALGPEGRTRGQAGLTRCHELFSDEAVIETITAVYEEILASNSEPGHPTTIS